MSTAAFLDRDGTVARDVPYCSRPEDFELFPGVIRSTKLLRECGLKVILITNQSGIGRGYFTWQNLERIHRKLRQELARGGTSIDAIYCCPHHPDDGCQCRKPKPGLLFQAAQEMKIDLSRSYVVGDSISDVEAGQRAGCRTILIAPAPPQSTLEANPDFTAPDLPAAVQWIWLQEGQKHCLRGHS